MLTKKRIRSRCIALLAVLLAALFISPPCALAQQTAFHEDYAAIEQAAQSVVLLEVYDQTEKLIATGSGFVAFDNQTVVTNYHVIEDAYLIKAYGDAGFFYRINDVIAADESKDIAILSFESPSIIQPLELAHDAKLMRGEPVVAIGSPVGIKNTVSTGNISTLLADDVGTVIQFTAPISHGSSGGALFNAQGQVIGVTFATLEAGQNLNYAVDIDDVFALYANHTGNKMSFADYFSGLETTPTAIPNASSTPAPKATNTPVPTPKKESAISALTAKQTGPNSVELKWWEAGSSTHYSVFIYVSGSDKELRPFRTEGTLKTTHVVKDLVPGYTYLFRVSAGNDIRLEELLEVEEADKFSTRNFRAKSFAMYYYNTGEDIWEAKRKKMTTLKLSDLQKAGVTRNYVLVLDMTSSNADKDTKWDVLYAIILPDGSIKYRLTTMTAHKDNDYGWLYAWDITKWIADCVKDYQKGTYQIKLYINGQPAAKTSFKAK